MESPLRPVDHLIADAVRCIQCGKSPAECRCEWAAPNEGENPAAVYSGRIWLLNTSLRVYVLNNGQRIIDGDDLNAFLFGRGD